MSEFTKEMTKIIMETETNTNSIESTRPAQAAKALELFCEGQKTIKEISEELGMSYWTLIDFKRRHREVIADKRAQLAEEAFELAEGTRQLAKKKIQMLAEDPEALREMNLRDLNQAYKLAMDAGCYTLGTESRVTIEHKKEGISLEDAHKIIEEAKKQVRTIEMKDAAVDAVVIEEIKP